MKELSEHQKVHLRIVRELARFDFLILCDTIRGN